MPNSLSPTLDLPATDRHDPIAALRYPDFLKLLIGRFFVVLVWQVQTIAIGWELYEKTHSAFALGLVGLCQFLPVLLFTLPAGVAADRYNRKWIICVVQGGLAIVSVGLAVASWQGVPLWAIYALLALGGSMRSFNHSAGLSILPTVVPASAVPNATVWMGSTFQIASVLGPVMGGILIATWQNLPSIYLLNALFCVLSLLCFMTIRQVNQEKATDTVSLRSFGAGLDYVRNSPVILSTITLDMFAVLFGGVTALLPIYAKDILMVGAEGLGWLRTAGAIGAVMMSLILAYWPPVRNTGKILLSVVVGYGIAIIVFGLSRDFWLSFVMLGLAGAMDAVSMMIRATLVQLQTPDALRGRVSAVNYVFIASSNELGSFESGFVAGWFGPVFSAVSGGIGTIVTVLAVMWFWPSLRRFDSLTAPLPTREKAEE